MKMGIHKSGRNDSAIGLDGDLAGGQLGLLQRDDLAACNAYTDDLLSAIEPSMMNRQVHSSFAPMQRFRIET